MDRGDGEDVERIGIGQRFADRCVSVSVEATLLVAPAALISRTQQFTGDVQPVVAIGIAEIDTLATVRRLIGELVPETLFGLSHDRVDEVVVLLFPHL
jgi:hypothetical protein